MNQKKIAKLLNVSPSTVSKALSGSTEISKETAQMIQRVAIEEGYFKEKSKRKRDYTSNRSLLIALIVHEIMGYHYSSIITFIKDEIEKRGGLVSVYISDFSREKAGDILKSIILRGGTDGVIMFSLPLLEAKPNIPIVTVGGYSDKNYDGVVYSSNSILSTAVRYLSGLGHKKIGFVGEKLTISSMKAFKQAMQESHLDICEEHIYTSDCRFEEIGAEAASKIISQKKRPTALICAYDEIAISLTGNLQRNGIGVPDDISVMGINNISSSEHTQTPITTIDTFSAEQYKSAVSLLFDKIFNETSSVKHITVQHEVVERQTTKRLEEK